MQNYTNLLYGKFYTERVIEKKSYASKLNGYV